MWEFIIPLSLIEISPQTLAPASLFGLITVLARVLFGTSIGAQIDKQNRLLGTLFIRIKISPIWLTDGRKPSGLVLAFRLYR